MDDRQQTVDAKSTEDNKWKQRIAQKTRERGLEDRNWENRNGWRIGINSYNGYKKMSNTL